MIKKHLKFISNNKGFAEANVVGGTGIAFAAGLTVSQIVTDLTGVSTGVVAMSMIGAAVDYLYHPEEIKESKKRIIGIYLTSVICGITLSFFLSGVSIFGKIPPPPMIGLIFSALGSKLVPMFIDNVPNLFVKLFSKRNP